MSKYSAIESFQMSTMDEKRTIVSELFHAYKLLEEYDVNKSKRSVWLACSLWGDRVVEKVFVDKIEEGELKEAKEYLFRTSIYLLERLSPSKVVDGHEVSPFN